MGRSETVAAARAARCAPWATLPGGSGDGSPRRLLGSLRGRGRCDQLAAAAARSGDLAARSVALESGLCPVTRNLGVCWRFDLCTPSRGSRGSALIRCSLVRVSLSTGPPRRVPASGEPFSIWWCCSRLGLVPSSRPVAQRGGGGFGSCFWTPLDRSPNWAPSATALTACSVVSLRVGSEVDRGVASSRSWTVSHWAQVHVAAHPMSWTCPHEGHVFDDG